MTNLTFVFALDYIMLVVSHLKHCPLDISQRFVSILLVNLKYNR